MKLPLNFPIWFCSLFYKTSINCDNSSLYITLAFQIPSFNINFAYVHLFKIVSLLWVQYNCGSYPNYTLWFVYHAHFSSLLFISTSERGQTNTNLDKVIERAKTIRAFLKAEYVSSDE